MIGFGSKRTVTAVSAGLMAGLMSTGAWAQASVLSNCTTTQAGLVSGNLDVLAGPAAAAGSSVVGAIANANTAFLSNQGSAFVSAPANPAPDQPGGGIWVRGVGGEVTVNSNTSSTLVAQRGGGNTGAPFLGTTTQNTNCNNSDRQSFAGVQVGADIARLNWNGWNVHLGTTAGYLGTKSNDSFGFGNKFDIPFMGTYLVATYGRFFADVLVRSDYYNISLNNPGFTFFNQPVSAHGYSISSSAGYNFALQNNWFIEPSAGFIYSRTKIDDFTYSGNPALAIGGTISSPDVTSELGRLSVRVGTTIATPNVVWQPFASASVFHEFANAATTNFSAFANNGFYLGLTPSTYNQQTRISRIGTYGQYSLGVAAQVVNTGWLGFVRFDYRNGDRIDGYTGNVGLRYQFTPGGPMNAMAADLPRKAKAPVAYIAPTNWTGFFIGGFFGGDDGRTRIDLANAVGASSTRPYVFGPIGGGQIGYNWQGASPWVFGVEGDIAAADVKGARRCGVDPALDVNGNPSGALASAYFTCRDRSDWIATATARVGYSYDRTLYYVRGGGAWEDSTVSANCVLGPTGVIAGGGRACTNGQVVGGAFATPTLISTNDRTRSGWLIGFGTEFDLGRGWSAKSEYNYIDFGSRTQLASDGFTTIRDRAYTNQVKVGVNYRFGGPSAVVAKY